MTGSKSGIKPWNPGALNVNGANVVNQNNVRYNQVPAPKTPQDLTRCDIERQFRLACDDLYVSTLKTPIIVDSSRYESALNKELPPRFAGEIPQGFFIDPRLWRVYFDVGSMPGFLTEARELLAFARSLFHHELTHFTLYPASRQNEVKQIVAIYNGFTDERIKEDPVLTRSFAFLVNNIFGDFIGDSYLACMKYGKRNFRPLTVWRQRVCKKNTRLAEESDPSPLWKILTRLYEIVWKSNLGFFEYTTLTAREKNILSNILQALGNDWMVETKWLEKVRKFAAALEPLLLDLEISGERYILLPRDLAGMFTDQCESPIGSGDSLDDQALRDLLKNYCNDPIGFAGCVSALSGSPADEGIRLMYRTRAREIALKLDEIRRCSERDAISRDEDWSPGDQVTGKGGLKLMDTFISFGRPIPWVNTLKGLPVPLHSSGNRAAVYDLLLVIDSSGSMSWDPMEPAPERRGHFDKAILAGESAALYAIEHGAKVAVINFAGPEDIRFTEHFTTSLNSIEEVLMWTWSGGTVFPVETFARLLTDTRNPLLTLFLSDCEIHNHKEALLALGSAITRYDRLCVFQTCVGPLEHFCHQLAGKGAETYAIRSPSDLVNIVIGRVARQYVSIHELDLQKEAERVL